MSPTALFPARTLQDVGAPEYAASAMGAAKQIPRPFGEASVGAMFSRAKAERTVTKDLFHSGRRMCIRSRINAPAEDPGSFLSSVVIRRARCVVRCAKWPR